MRVEEISKLAWGKKYAKGLNAAEQLLLLLLTELYSSARKGIISKDDAIKRKAQIVAKCEEYDKAYAGWCSVWKYHQENIRLVGTLTSDIEKEKDIIKATFKAFEAIGRMTGDKGFLKRQERKFENENILHRQEVQDR